MCACDLFLSSLLEENGPKGPARRSKRLLPSAWNRARQTRQREQNANLNARPPPWETAACRFINFSMPRLTYISIWIKDEIKGYWTNSHSFTLMHRRYYPNSGYLWPSKRLGAGCGPMDGRLSIGRYKGKPGRIWGNESIGRSLAFVSNDGIWQRECICTGRRCLPR